MNDYLFLQPGWLFCIPLIFLFLIVRPWLIGHGLLRTESGVISAAIVKHPQAANHQAQASKSTNSHLFFIAVSTILLLVALAQPIRLGAQVETPATSADIMLIIDTSISMVMRDYQLEGKRVNRMTMTKALLDRFTRRFSGKRIGIVLLGDQPQILLQPSEDKALVRYMIHQLKPTISGRNAALGDAIAVAADYIGSDKIKDETVMVLISSADTPLGKLSPITGAERARDAGAILHTIAIGSSDSQDSQSGELLFEEADLALLNELALLTGGKSFHAKNVAVMDAALMSIEKHHQTVSNKEWAPRLKHALYQWPLLAAIFLLMMMALLPLQGRGKAA